MMEEMQACARPLGLEMSITPAERIAVTQRLGVDAPFMRSVLGMAKLISP
jgi:hypothetical protein